MASADQGIQHDGYANDDAVIEDSDSNIETSGISDWNIYEHSCGLAFSFPSDYAIINYDDGTLNRIANKTKGADV